MPKGEKEFIKEINVDKAIIKTNIAMILIIINLVTYIIPLILGEFDFGIIFEVVGLVFLLMARFYMSYNNENNSSRYIFLSMLSVGWLLIYDIIYLISYMENIFDLVQIGYIYYFNEIILIVYLKLLFMIKKDLAKSTGDEKYKESTDWYYDKYEQDK